MKKKLSLTGATLVGIVLTLTVLLSLGSNADNGKLLTALAAAQEDTIIHLPVITNKYPLQTVFGIGVKEISTAGGLDALTESKSTWIRRDGVRWLAVEPEEGVYNWDALNGLEGELKAASSRGVRVVLIVQGTPAWAQKNLGSICGPIKEDKLPAFANFMYELVRRYSVSPYNVKYWEIWNEPDVDSWDFEEGFGCWGDNNDEYYGGGYYGEMLKHVYPAVKRAHRSSKVIIGGLLMDCDPRREDLCVRGLDHGTKTGRFLDGILLNGGGDYFDGISFHGYDYYDHGGSYGNANWDTKESTTGPVLIAKAAFLREVLNKYNVNGKFLMNTESAVICDDGCGGDDPNSYESTKARYVVHAYAAAMAQGLEANLWYDMYGWRNSGLLNKTNGTPRPAYDVYDYASKRLGSATFTKTVSFVQPVDGYEFGLGSRKILVLWSKDGVQHSVTLDRPPLTITDAYGAPIPVSGPTVLVGRLPLYIEMP